MRGITQVGKVNGDVKNDCRGMWTWAGGGGTMRMRRMKQVRGHKAENLRMSTSYMVGC